MSVSNGLIKWDEVDYSGIAWEREDSKKAGSIIPTIYRGFHVSNLYFRLDSARRL